MPRPRRALVPLSPGSLPSNQTNFNLTVRIYDKPHYVRGQTDLVHTQPPITIVPPRDTDAFIIDKVVTPFDASDEDPTVRKILNYVVGWPDRPYARQLVPCTEVLDYVSPRELEDYEYRLTLRIKAEKAAAKEAEEAAAKAKKERKRVGRPAKLHHQNKMAEKIAAHAHAPAKSNGQETVAQPSTPPPPKRRRLLGPGQKRKHGPSTSAVEPSAATEHKVGTTPTKPISAAAAATVAAAASAAAAAAIASPTGDKKSPTKADVHLIIDNIPAFASGNQRTGFALMQQLEPADAKNATATSTEAEEEHGDAESDIAEEDILMVGQEPNIYGIPINGHNQGRHPTSVRLQDYDDDDDDGNDEDEDENDVDEDAEMPDHERVRIIVESPAQSKALPLSSSPPSRITPVLPPQVLGMPGSSHVTQTGSLKAGRESTTRTKTSKSRSGTGSSRRSSSSHHRYQASKDDDPVELVQVGDEEEEISHEQGHERSRDRNDVYHSHSQDYLPSMPQGEPQQEELYEVDSLEGDMLAPLDDGNAAAAAGASSGRLVRFFLVRWKGDWPPDQNPTWEPAENLPRGMVRSYLKRAARRQASKHVQHAQTPNNPNIDQASERGTN